MFRELTGSFAELIKNYKYSALHGYMRTHVRTFSWLYLAEFDQCDYVRSDQGNRVRPT